LDLGVPGRHGARLPFEISKMKESSKLRNILTPDELKYFKGEGMDIGCGNDPIFPDCFTFEQCDGDANNILKYVRRQYDWVYSSHYLEHMQDPAAALKDWGTLVKVGGYLIITVPDEDLYEQGHFPSIYNTEHKHTFTISKRKSWSLVSVNLLDLANNLDDFELVKIELQDMDYNRSLIGVDQTKMGAMAQIMCILRKVK